MLDGTHLDRLRQLDDQDDFLGGLIRDFIADAEQLVEELEAAALHCDAAAFRDRAHALRSSAAHLGATALFELCLEWRGIGTDELAAEGGTYAMSLLLDGRMILHPVERPGRRQSADRTEAPRRRRSRSGMAPLLRPDQMLHPPQIGFVETESGLHPHVGDVDQLLVGDRLTALADPAERQQGAVAPSIALEILTHGGGAVALVDHQIHQSELLELLSLI